MFHVLFVDSSNLGQYLSLNICGAGLLSIWTVALYSRAVTHSEHFPIQRIFKASIPFTVQCREETQMWLVDKRSFEKKAKLTVV